LTISQATSRATKTPPSNDVSEGRRPPKSVASLDCCSVRAEAAIREIL